LVFERRTQRPVADLEGPCPAQAECGSLCGAAQITGERRRPGMEGLDLIRTVYTIDHHLEDIVASVTDEALKRKVSAFRSEWQETQYLLTKLACGIEHGTVKKRMARKQCGSGEEGAERTGDSLAIPSA